jgi:hypothetical protein
MPIESRTKYPVSLVSLDLPVERAWASTVLSSLDSAGWLETERT